MVLNVGIGVMFSAILVLSLIPYDYDASAATCRIIPIEEQYEISDLIFVGKVIEKEHDKSILEYTTIFEIEKVYKGDPLTEAEVESISIFDKKFEVGEKYLVFAIPKDSHFLVGVCFRTFLVSESTMNIINQVILLSEQEPESELPVSESSEQEREGMTGLTAKDYQKAMEQIETARFWSFWSGYVALGIIAFFSLIFYFATWVVVKKILHKKHPKLIGAIVVIVFIFILFILYYGLASR